MKSEDNSNISDHLNEYDFKKYMVVYRLSEKTINVIFEDDKGFL